MSLKRNFNFKVFLFGGKGGVGKTTLSSSFAVGLAKGGLKVLLISTDPAHSLSDLFSKNRAFKSLNILEIDPKEEINKHVDLVLRTAERLLHPDSLKHLKEMLKWIKDSPEMEEVASLEALIRHVVQEYDNFDVFVIDTAPTGHTLKMLKSVNIMGGWIEEIIRKKESLEAFREASKEKRAKDNTLSLLKERRKRHERFLRILKEDALFVPVMLPEKLPLEETKRLVKELKDLGLNLKFLIINKVLPSSEDEFIQRRKKFQNLYIEEARKSFKDLKILEIPLLDKDIDSLEELEALGSLILENVKQI